MLDQQPGDGLACQEYQVLGTRPIRHDGTDKMTGRARYSADINLPGLLYGKILRSPHAHAHIQSIDPSRALQLPGVLAVVTGADLPQHSSRMMNLGEGGEGANINPRFLSNNVLALDKVLYKGHAVAAVAAVSSHVAQEALALIDVDYEPLPPVLDALEAMREDAPLLHERLMTLSNPGFRVGSTRAEDDPSKGSNIANHFDFRLGDVELGFQEADVILEREYQSVYVHQGYIEPHSATAWWGIDGNITIWSSSQGQFTVRDQTAMILGIPVSRIKAIPMEIGGGFGGKTLVYVEPVAVLLSHKTGRPVKVAMSRAEVFEGTGPTSGTHIKVKLGVKEDGHISAAEAHLIYEAGAFPGSPVPAGVQCIFAPYNIPNAYVEGYDVVVNKPKTAAYRAPGSPAAAFAMESLVDEICEKIGLDPTEFRLINAAKEGTRRATGPVFGRIGYAETLEAARAHPHYAAPLGGPNRGRGIASGFWGNGSGPASAIASVNSDGTVSLVEGSPDIGGSRTVAAMHVAEVLGIAAEDVKPSVGGY
jgi:xanthine dehydrogenase molybdenum-binding subunit